MVDAVVSRKLKNLSMETLKIGQRVEKLGSEKDYATGRRGEVVEIPNESNVIEPDRVRVKWDTHPSGNPMKPIKTKVNLKFLRVLPI